jgi:hypothetical protein
LLEPELVLVADPLEDPDDPELAPDELPALDPDELPEDPDVADPLEDPPLEPELVPELTPEDAVDDPEPALDPLVEPEPVCDEFDPHATGTTEKATATAVRMRRLVRDFFMWGSP